MNKPTMPKEYRALLHRWGELRNLRRHLRELTASEAKEMAAITAQLHEFELAHRQQSIIETVTSDYADLGEIGHLGGVEL